MLYIVNRGEFALHGRLRSPVPRFRSSTYVRGRNLQSLLFSRSTNNRTRALSGRSSNPVQSLPPGCPRPKRSMTWHRPAFRPKSLLEAVEWTTRLADRVPGATNANSKLYLLSGGGVCLRSGAVPLISHGQGLLGVIYLQWMLCGKNLPLVCRKMGWAPTLGNDFSIYGKYGVVTVCDRIQSSFARPLPQNVRSLVSVPMRCGRETSHSLPENRTGRIPGVPGGRMQRRSSYSVRGIAAIADQH